MVEPRVAGAMVGDSALQRKTTMDDALKAGLLKFLSSRLEDSDMGKVRAMLDVDDEGNSAAMDAMLRSRVRQAQRRSSVASEAAWVKQFPASLS
jgi:hypothetical protein